MSYKKPNKPRKTARMFYPNHIEISGRIISTGPYRKEIAGTTYDSVYMYLQHLEEIVKEKMNKKNKQ